MPHCIVRIFEPLLRLFWPAPGRHRSSTPPSTDPCAEASTACPPCAPAPLVLRGEEIGLVRPYLVAYERREQQRRRTRRRVVLLAVHGFDLGARLLKGVEVRAC
jgi:hypothetical protein